jgi:AcrR family transcriptional regulator
MTTRPRGRPRDQAIDAAILEATQELIVELGYAALSMDGVAARAGVSKPTLYLRYPSKGALIAEAAFGDVPDVQPPDTGHLSADFLATYQWGVAQVTAPVGRAALPGLLAESTQNPEIADLFREKIIEPAFARIADLLVRAQQRGEIRAGVDLALVLDVCLGTVLARVAMVDRPINDEFAAELVALLVSGLAPR